MGKNNPIHITSNCLRNTRLGILKNMKTQGKRGSINGNKISSEVGFTVKKSNGDVPVTIGKLKLK